ncbi:hypothetical protein [Streptomyces sp. NPDC086787]|uniref:hypothetical protein n=1 Tax=Streptomyces sp. NPDC086787 TaxID=3365759 RepID=UPI0037FA9CD0
MAQRKLPRASRVMGSAAMGAALALMPVLPAHAATTIDVDCTGDTGAALQGAIGSALDGDTVRLTPFCVYTLTTEASPGDGLPAIVGKSITVLGRGATIQRPPTESDFRIFEVGIDGALDLQDVTVMGGALTGNGGGIAIRNHGTLTAERTRFEGNIARITGAGGAIFSESVSSITLTDCTVADNSADQGGGIQAGSDLTLTRTVVRGNRGQIAGGVISFTDTLTVQDSTIKDNSASVLAGGLFVGSGTADVQNTRILDNTGARVGGVDVGTSATATITGSFINGNTVTDASGALSGGGGVRTTGDTTIDSTEIRGNRLIGDNGRGAGISAPSGTLTLRNNSSVTANLASGRYSRGGGLYADGTTTGVTVSVAGSHLDGNKVTGTGSTAAGVYNNGGAISFTSSTVNNNTAPNAPAPGGVSTTVPITSVDGATTFTGNTPTNCLLSPAAVTNCTN